VEACMRIRAKRYLAEHIARLNPRRRSF
jgi:hypothetical protein